MNTRILTVTVTGAALLIMAMTLGGGQNQSDPAPVMDDGFGVQVSVDRPTYAKGDPMAVAVRVHNGSDVPVVLPFNTSQRYDFTIDDSEGNCVWRWSNERMFLQVLGAEVLNAERSQLTYRETFTETLEPGLYTVTGRIESRGVPMSASATIVVE